MIENQLFIEQNFKIQISGEDEVTPVITETMVQRMEDYMKAKTELEDTIDEFQKILGSTDGEDDVVDKSFVEHDPQTELFDVVKDPNDIPVTVSKRMEEFESAKKELESSISDFRLSSSKDQAQDTPRGQNVDSEIESGICTEEDPNEVNDNTFEKESSVEEIDVKYPVQNELKHDQPLVSSPDHNNECFLEELLPAPILLDDDIKPKRSVPEIMVEVVEPVKCSAPNEIEKPEVFLPVQSAPPLAEEPATEVEASSQAESEDSVNTGEFAPTCSSFSEKVERLEALIGRQRSLALAGSTEEEEEEPKEIIMEAGDVNVSEVDIDNVISVDDNALVLGPNTASNDIALACSTEEIEETKEIPSKTIEEDIPAVKVDNIISVSADAPVFEPFDAFKDIVEDLPPPISENELVPEEIGKPDEFEQRREVPMSVKEDICFDLAETKEKPVLLSSKKVDSKTHAKVSKKIEDQVPHDKYLAEEVEEDLEIADLEELGKPDEFEQRREVPVPVKEEICFDLAKTKQQPVLLPSKKVDSKTHAKVSKKIENQVPHEKYLAEGVEKDLEIADLEVIKEERSEFEDREESKSDVEGMQPFSDGEEVVMKPERAPLPNNNSLNMAPRRYSFEQEVEAEKAQDYVGELKERLPKRSMNSSGHTSDSDRSTASEKGQQPAIKIWRMSSKKADLKKCYFSN